MYYFLVFMLGALLGIIFFSFFGYKTELDNKRLKEENEKLRKENDDLKKRINYLSAVEKKYSKFFEKHRSV